MSQSTALKPIQIDTGDIDSLLSRMHDLDGPGIGHTAHTRLRYLGKIGFPASAKAGRGKRSVHDLPAVLKLATVFEMLDLGTVPSRAVATVNGNWPELRDAFSGAWQALQRSRSNAPGIGATRDERAAHRELQVEQHRTIIVLSPRSLAGSDSDPLTLATTSLEAERSVLKGSRRGSRARAIIDPYAIVSDLEKELEQELRYRKDEVAAAFDALRSQIDELAA